MSGPVESPIWASLVRLEELAGRLHQLGLDGDPDLSGRRDTSAELAALIQELVAAGEELGRQIESVMAGHELGPPTGTIAHDFNNLLSIMQGHLELLSDSADLPRPVVERADKIAAAAVRGKALVANLSAIGLPAGGGLVASDPLGRHESGA